MSFPWTLSAGEPYAVLSSTPGKASPIIRTVSKSIVLLGIGCRVSAGLTDLLRLGIGINLPLQVDVVQDYSRQPFSAWRARPQSQSRRERASGSTHPAWR